MFTPDTQMAKTRYIEIDGAHGEGGGQVLRTSLALSVITGKAFRITSIRGNRQKPGLMRQHLTAVNAAAEISGASVAGAELHSQELTFAPSQAGAIPGNYNFAIGSAGSTSLVLQTILMPLLLAAGDSTVTIQGGTHNPMAPPFPYLEKVFVPLLHKLGATFELEMTSPGFVPAGGGEICLRTKGNAKLDRLDLTERGRTLNVIATAVTAGGVRGDVAKRELKVIAEKLTITPENLLQRTLTGSFGSGNFVCIEIESEHITELFTSIGQLGKTAETVGSEAANEARKYLTVGAPVGSHLADQLLLPLALGAGGEFVTSRPTPHTRTNAEIIQMFLARTISLEPIEDTKAWRIRVD